ncbi:MAG: preprotein translocase subunit SecB, partial [Pseudomonadota bacterium]|nr:preprotein translocase subunit SecB [Pseudomonadota bacterium]
MSEQQEAPSFSIEKLYLKDLSVEVPNAPAIFLEPDSPQVEIQLQTNAQALGDGAYEVTLTVTVTARIEDKTVFLVEVGQAGIFRIQNVPDENLEPLIAVACPNILFPYAREVVSDAVTRAGFSPVVLQPVNFEGMYMARMQEAQAQA